MDSKICRVCGVLDKRNHYIFQGGNSTLAYEIMMVYPILLYKDDPLPKWICIKCHSNVMNAYFDIQRVANAQRKWISKIQESTPEHNYIKLLKSLEDSKTLIEKSVTTTIPKIGDRLMHPLFPSKTITKKTNITNSTKYKTYVRVKKQKTDMDANSNEMDEDNIALAKLVENSVKVYKCKHCKQTFDSNENLVIHAKKHLRIRVYNIFPKKMLHNNDRRGHVIDVNGKTSIRCVCCERQFDDNKDILKHWKEGNCEFYCLICGAEFNNAPSALSVHVSEEHGISADKLNEIRKSYEATQIHPKLPKLNTTCSFCKQKSNGSCEFNSSKQLHHGSKNDQKNFENDDKEIEKNFSKTMNNATDILLQSEIKCNTDDNKQNNEMEPNTETPETFIAQAKSCNYSKNVNSNATVTTSGNSAQRNSLVRGIRMKFVQPRSIAQVSRTTTNTTSTESQSAVLRQATTLIEPESTYSINQNPKFIPLKVIHTSPISNLKNPIEIVSKNVIMQIQHTPPITTIPAVPVANANPIQHMIKAMPKIKVKPLSELQKTPIKRVNNPLLVSESNPIKRIKHDFLDLTNDDER